MRVFFETQDQALVALAMIVTGFAAGFLYDFLSAFKRGKKHLSCAVIDILIFTLTGVLAAMVLVYFAQPRVRYYNVLGLILGGAIYALLPHRFFTLIGRTLSRHKQKRMEKAALQEKTKKQRTLK